jgi:hypothetical protein
LETAVYGWAFLAVEVKKLYVRGCPGQCEYVVDLAGSACHDQPYSGAAGIDAGVDDDVRGGAVHEGQFAHVEHDEVGEHVGFFEGPFEPWAAREVQFAGQVHPERPELSESPCADE